MKAQPHRPSRATQRPTDQAVGRRGREAVWQNATGRDLSRLALRSETRRDVVVDRVDQFGTQTSAAAPSAGAEDGTVPSIARRQHPACFSGFERFTADKSTPSRRR